MGIGFTRNKCLSSRRRLGGAAVPWLSQMGKAEAVGGPLSVIVAGANVRDDKLLEATLEAIVVD